MKLSDAIATGRVLAKPGTCYFVRRDTDGGTTACAIGMATLAVGVGVSDYRHKWPWLLTLTEGKRPCGCERPGHYNDFACDIAHIFDIHIIEYRDWTLDQLIDWIASVEPAEPAPAAEPVVAEAEAVRQL